MHLISICPVKVTPNPSTSHHQLAALLPVKSIQKNAAWFHQHLFTSFSYKVIFSFRHTFSLYSWLPWPALSRQKMTLGFHFSSPFRTHPTQFFMKYSALPLHSHLKAHVTCRPFQMPSFWRKTLSLVTFPCPFPMASAGGVDPRPMLNTAQLHDLGSDFWGSCYVLRSCTVRSRQDKGSGAAEWVTFLRYRPSAAQVLRS